MSIRTVLPSFLSIRAWPGIRSWFLSVLASSLVFSALAALAWRGEVHRLPDLTAFLIIIPGSILVILLGIALLWRWMAQIPFPASLTFLARILPVAWVVPLVDILRSVGAGVAFHPSSLDSSSIVLAAITATLLPMEFPVPFAIRAGILAATLIVAFVIWFTRRRFIAAIASALMVSAVLTKILFSPVSSTGVINGYWWSTIYERFPVAVDAQLATALRLSTAGHVVFALGVVAALCAFPCLPALRRLVLQAFYSRSSLQAVAYVAVGVVLGVVSGTAVSFGSDWWVAVCVGILLVLALRLHFVLERTRFAPSFSEHETLSPAILRDTSLLTAVFALAAAWVLGWPVFAAIVAAMAASMLSRHSLWAEWPIAPTLFRAAGAASLGLSGAFFSSQQAQLSVPMVLMAVALAVFQVGVERVKPPRLDVSRHSLL